MEIKKHKAFTLSALALLVASILLISMNVPTSAQEYPPIYLHGPPLTPIHMNSNKTLTPVHMHSKEGLIDPSTDPICTYWHELYPNYCTDWHLSSWKDAGEPFGELSPNDQIDMINTETDEIKWYHVDRMTVTLNLSWPYPPPEPPPETKIIWFVQITEPGPWGIEEPITLIAPCKWYRVVATDPKEPCFVPPPCSWWHIFYPEQLYCIYFHVDKSQVIEEPPGSGIFYHDFHIDIVLPEPIVPDPSVPEAQAEWKTPPVERIFVELKTPGWDPSMDPNCTLWHEVWPSYSNVYHCVGWRDSLPNGIVDFCDEVDLNNTKTGSITTWHVDGVATDLILREKIMDPKCTWWHEIYPEYCKWYHLTSWEDTGWPEGMGPCDQINMTDEEGITTLYHVDRVTVTINVTLEPGPAKWMKIELKTYYFEEMYEVFKYPWESLWHEVYPSYSNVYLLTNWDLEYDDNCNGVLDSCDYIWLLNLTNPFAKPERYHIVDMNYDIILNQKIINPVSSIWHELYPEYSNKYHIDAWEDNGDGLLSPCDQISMTLMPVGTMEEYHVENVMLTLNVSSAGEFIFIEAVIPFGWMYRPKTIPQEALWHEVWPNFCTNYSVTNWIDNCNGVLDPCDNITLVEDGVGVPIQWHVEEVAVDMVVEEKPVHDVAVIDVFSLYPQVDQGEVDPINVTVENQGDFPEKVDVYAFYNESLAAPKQTITTLNPGQNITLTFNWNTTGVPLGTYTISANATILIDDDPTDNIRVAVDTQEVIPEFTPAIIPPLFIILSLITVVFKFKKKKQ